MLGEAEDGGVAVELAATLRPDVVLMDLRMPRLDGVAATRAITGAPGAPRAFLMLTTFDRDEHLYDAIRAGAGGFLLKSSPPEQLNRCVRIIAAGESLLAPALTRRLLDEFAQRPLPGRVDEQRLRLTSVNARACSPSSVGPCPTARSPRRCSWVRAP